MTPIQNSEATEAKHIKKRGEEGLTNSQIRHVQLAQLDLFGVGVGWPGQVVGDARQGRHGGFESVDEQVDRDTGVVFALDVSGWSFEEVGGWGRSCLLYTSPSPRDGLLSRMPSSA